MTSMFQELLDKQGKSTVAVVLLNYNFVLVTALYKRQIAEEEELITTLSKRIREMEQLVNRQRRAMGGSVTYKH